MRKSKILYMALAAFFIMVSVAEANTKAEIEKILNQKLSKEEYEELMDARQSETDKTLFELFEDVVEEKREEAQNAGRSNRRYIQISEKRFKDQKRARKNSVDESEYVDDEKPLNINEPKKRRRRSLSKDKADQDSAAVGETEEKRTLEDERELLKAKSAEGLINKRRKLKDRKKEAYRTPDKRKKIDDYNRTKKKKRFGGARVDDEVEDEGFNTKAFKKKQFGSKVISEQREKSKKEAETKKSQKKKYGGKLIRRGTIQGEDRKKSMFDD